MNKKVLSTEFVKSNIINLYDEIPLDKKTTAITWYNDAHNFCLSVSVRFNIELKLVVGVLAALSPRNKWAHNKKDCIALIKGFADGEDINNITVHTFNRNKLKAWNILSTKVVDLGGLKVNSFYNNIINPSNARDVTIDVWAIRVALNNNTFSKSITEKQYGLIKEGYIEAFDNLKDKHKYLQTPSQLQAICWTYIRDA
jgi:hypothetical protein